MPTQAVLGWATLGVGGAVFTVGVVLGSVALAKRNALDCPDGRCPAELADDVETVNGLRVPSTITIAAGLVGLGTGTLLLLTVPDREEVTLSVGPTGGRLRVMF
jgi:hypothetical protein